MKLCTIIRKFDFFAKHIEKIELICLHCFFIQVVFCFYGKTFICRTFEVVLLAAAPICAILGIKAEKKVRKQMLFVNLFFLLSLKS